MDGFENKECKCFMKNETLLACVHRICRCARTNQIKEAGKISTINHPIFGTLFGLSLHNHANRERKVLTKKIRS